MFRCFALLLSASILFASAGRAQTAAFDPGLNVPGADYTVRCSALHDDGSGPALYVGGGFFTIGGVVSPGIARWDGTTWTSVGGGLGQIGNFLASPGFARTPSVVALRSFGGRLYAGGDFVMPGSTTVDHFAVWDGTQWTIPPGSPTQTVTAIDVFQGSLVVGGKYISTSGGAGHVARFDPANSSWSIVGLGGLGGDGSVLCFATYLENGVPYLYAGGNALSVLNGGSTLIARWDGTTWTRPGTGLAGAAHRSPPFAA